MSPSLTIEGIRARPVKVPMRRPLHTGGGAVDVAPLVLIDLTTKEGVVGRSYLFCYTPLALGPVTQLVGNLATLIAGDAVAPFDIEQKLQRRLRLIGPQGMTGMALAGIDMAAWDALAQAAGVPLVRLLGGTPQPVAAYNSCGLGLIGPERAAAEARELAAPGFKAIKVRLGYADLATDLAVMRSVREAVGSDLLLMTDYNQCLSVPEAIRRAHALEATQAAWIEEPTLADDAAGHARIARAAKLPVQLGENWWGPHDMARALAAGACDFAMPDAMKIGGVTGWLRAAALAEAQGVPMSSHLYPEISAHLLAVTPTRHWLEYVDWASPILRAPIAIEAGSAVIRDEPGTGIDWDEAAVAKYLVA